MANNIIGIVRLIGLALLIFILLLDDPISTLLQTIRQESNIPIVPVPVAAAVQFSSSCDIINSDFKSDLKSFLVDIHQLFIVGNELEEYSLEDDILHSDVREKYAIRHYFRMIRVVSRLFEPALKQYIKDVDPKLELAISSYTSLVIRAKSSHAIHSNSSGVFLKVSDFAEQRLDEVVSGNLQLYSAIHNGLDFRRDMVYRILSLLQEYLDDLVIIVSSQDLDDCQEHHNQSIFSISGIWTLISAVTGYDFNPDRGKLLETCQRTRTLVARVGDLVQRLLESNRNLRGRFDELQSDLKHLGDLSLSFLLGEMGRAVSVERYLDITSTLACGCSRVRDFLALVLTAI